VTAAPLADDRAWAIPDYVSPVEAWRVWKVGVRNAQIVLESLFAQATWEPGVPLAAICVTGHRSRWRPWRVQLNDHPAPDFGCTCGIYGVATSAAAQEYLSAHRFASRGDRVFGRVALWGDVVESEVGWRASYAYPLEIFVPVAVAERGGLRRRAYLEEIAFGLESYRVPVDFVAAQPGLGVVG